MSDWEFYYENGKFFFRKWKNYEKALNFFNTALTLKPKHADCLYHKGLCLVMLGKPDEAYENISQAFCISPHLQICYDNPDLLVTICLLLEEHGDNKNALSLCNKAIPRFPSNTELVKQRSRLQDKVDSAKRKTFEQTISPTADTAIQTEPKIIPAEPKIMPTVPKIIRVWPPEPVEITNVPDKKKFDIPESPSQKSEGKNPDSIPGIYKTVSPVKSTKSISSNQNPHCPAKISRDSEQNNSQDIQYLGIYYGFYSTKQDPFSGNIWKLKIINDNNEAGTPPKDLEDIQRQIEVFSNDIITHLNPDPDWVICVVPTSSKAREPGGMRQVAKKICEKSYIDGLHVIERIKDFPPSYKDKKSSSRDYETELASLRITDTELIKGRSILLLDDVTTEGNSLEAAKSLLLSHGAKQVLPFALGKTSY